MILFININNNDMNKLSNTILNETNPSFAKICKRYVYYAELHQLLIYMQIILAWQSKFVSKHQFGW